MFIFRSEFTNENNGIFLGDAGNGLQRQSRRIQYNAHVENHLQGIGQRSNQPRRCTESLF